MGKIQPTNSPSADTLHSSNPFYFINLPSLFGHSHPKCFPHLHSEQYFVFPFSWIPRTCKTQCVQMHCFPQRKAELHKPPGLQSPAAPATSKFPRQSSSPSHPGLIFCNITLTWQPACFFPSFSQQHLLPSPVPIPPIFLKNKFNLSSKF